MIIGITGNSAVGKSFLIRNIEKDYFLIDADKIGHSVLLMADCKAEVVNIFGNEILQDGEIVRKRLGEIVFNDKNLLNKLTKITHYYILKEIDSLIEENKNKHKIIILDAALLIESGLHEKCDKTILVTASYEQKIAKMVERDNISEELAKARLDKQTNDSKNQKNVDIVFENSYNLKAIQNFNNIINRMV